MNVVIGQDLLELYKSGTSKKYKEIARNPQLMHGFIRAISIMATVSNAAELCGFSYLHYERLRYQMSGLSSVRLSNNPVHRLIFKETPDGMEVQLIERDNTHYGNKH